MPVIKCHLGYKNWLNKIIWRGPKLGSISRWGLGLIQDLDEDPDDLQDSLTRLEWGFWEAVDCSLMKLSRTLHLDRINMQPGRIYGWGIFFLFLISASMWLYYVSSSCMRQIETRCDEKFVNIECRRAGRVVRALSCEQNNCNVRCSGSSGRVNQLFSNR